LQHRPDQLCWKIFHLMLEAFTHLYLLLNDQPLDTWIFQKNLVAVITCITIKFFKNCFSCVGAILLFRQQ
jgi:hypothetical protein